MNDQALFQDVTNHDLAGLKYHLGLGAHPDVKDVLGRTPLIVAVSLGFLDVMAVILQYQDSPIDRNNALMTAIYHGDLDAVSLLLQNGVDPKGIPFNPPLIAAVQQRNQAMVQQLVEYGAIIDAPDLSGKTALMIAVDHGYQEIVSYLLSKGADPNIRDMQGQTPLIIASEHSDPQGVYANIAHDLLAYPTKVNLIDARGNTALMRAVALGHFKVAQYLLDRGADLTIRNNQGQNVFDLANPRMKQLLLLYGTAPAQPAIPAFGKPFSNSVMLGSYVVRNQVYQRYWETYRGDYRAIYEQWTRTSSDEFRDQGRRSLADMSVPSYCKHLVPRKRERSDSFGPRANATTRWALAEQLGDHDHHYYLVLYYLQSLGRGSFGSTYLSGFVTTIEHSLMAQRCDRIITESGTQTTALLPAIQAPMQMSDLFYHSDHSTLLIKATAPWEADAYVLQELADHADTYGWFYPAYYGSRVLNHTAPKFWDPQGEVGSNLDNRQSLIFMEYLHGKPLFTQLSRLSQEERRVLELVLYTNLHAMYQSFGFVHGDLGSQNILLIEGQCVLPVPNEDRSKVWYVESNWRPILIDFGSAKTHRFPRTSELMSDWVDNSRDLMMIHVIFHPNSSLARLWAQQQGVSCTYRNLLGDRIYRWKVSLLDVLTASQLVLPPKEVDPQERILFYPTSQPLWIQRYQPRAAFHELLPLLKQIQVKLQKDDTYRASAQQQPLLVSYLRRLIHAYLR